MLQILTANQHNKYREPFLHVSVRRNISKANAC